VARRKNRPMFLIDIAVPRNIEPEVNQLDNVFLYDIDDLARVVDTNVKGRLEVAQQAEDIIHEEVERMMVRLKTREVAPTIVSLQEQLEQWRRGEIDRQRNKLGALTTQQEEAIEAITRGIVNKIAHGPISELRKQAADPSGMHVMNTIRRLFRLGSKRDNGVMPMVPSAYVNQAQIAREIAKAVRKMGQGPSSVSAIVSETELERR